ncbi:hypothetical protein [Microcoleus sp. bin38.metabat.b11b12b14.051]|uniref:hypothetical protein n=1 Tax=Microcoleus sp. bin38.metabat.b11b12b14.051 TaxID=2742709 RepID=UPI0025E961EF|nr:hypothetical protein [Microcoleus sp. bin38.metabat.b11b12b14.051]
MSLRSEVRSQKSERTRKRADRPIGFSDKSRSPATALNPLLTASVPDDSANFHG